MFCRIHAVQLHRARQELELTGARLVAIGQGTPAHAADFRRTQGIDIPILVDPDRASYSAAGAKIGTLSEVLGPRVMLTGLRRGRPLGLRLGKIDGDLGQLGGVLIVSPDGSIPYSYLSADASDVPSNADVLRAARQAVLALAGSA